MMAIPVPVGFAARRNRISVTNATYVVKATISDTWRSAQTQLVITQTRETCQAKKALERLRVWPSRVRTSSVGRRSRVRSKESGCLSRKGLVKLK